MAYERRMSDWMSDVCSSDLSSPHRRQRPETPGQGVPRQAGVTPPSERFMKIQPDRGIPSGLLNRMDRRRIQGRAAVGVMRGPAPVAPKAHHQRRADRKRVVSGKSVSVRVELGRRRIIKKKSTRQVNDKQKEQQ